MRFADDVVLVAKSGEELSYMAEDLRRESGEMGLTMNLSKTKILTNLEGIKPIVVNDKEIEIVSEYRYLGQIISFNNKMEKEIKIRRANAWKAFWALKFILKSKMKLKTKIRILESAVTPVLTYGGQTWSTTKKQLGKIQKT